MSQQVIFSMYRVSRRYPPGKEVIKDISLSFFYGAKIGVIGPNGAGKSTVLKIIAGLDTDYQGELSRSPGYTVGYLAQEPEPDDSKTVRQVVEEAVQPIIDALAEFDQINEALGTVSDMDEMEKLLERQGKVQDQLDASNAWDIDSRLDLAMDALRCPPADTPVSVISGGERRRVALTRLLLMQPDILLLDEPTNHLDAESVAWLEKHLQEYQGTVIAVTHDRYFLDNVAGWILELDRGRGIPWKGNYSSWLEQRQARLAQEEKSESLRQKTLQKELEWIRLTPKGQQAKSKARIAAYSQLVSEGGSGRQRDLEIYIPAGPRLGNLVIEAKDVAKAYDDRLLYEGLTFDVPAGAIVGVIGPNGAGKTTLFRMIVGQEEPDAGTLQVGQSVQLAYVDQSRDTLESDATVWEEISAGEEQLQLGDRSVNSRAYVSRFNFSGGDQQKKVGALSGGERNRVHLAKMLKSGANVLLLDEPTNDLDVDTLRALEEGLLNFGGSAVIISHDRWFLDRVATHILAFEGESSVMWYPGNYSDYEEDRQQRLGADADRPHRITYRKLRRD